VTPTHRALDDARATAHVFFELLERAGTIGATDLDDLMRLPTARGAPHYGKLRLTEGLPRTPGVYLFHDRTGEVIYVGKAKNLRSRVRSYFYGDRRRRVTQMMRDLTRVEHRVCPTEIEASITELRLINAHRPRYNRRSRPPKSTHWVRLTDEPFPRLVVARTQGLPALAYLGPFRRRRTAEQVVHALWDASPIRRCAGRPGSHPTCPHAQIGVAMCPGDGTLDPHRYTAAVTELLHGLEHEPQRLLDPLAARMALLAEHRRFEEAAELRDRCGGLARALETRRAWTALTAAGLVWAEDGTGTSLMIDSGRFAAAWTHPDPPPLTPVVADITALPTPATTTAAEELWLLWRWLDRPGVRSVDSTAPLAYPLRPVPSLTRLGGSVPAPG
jgi:DNA polymerase-3 subunit epsilon